MIRKTLTTYFVKYTGNKDLLSKIDKVATQQVQSQPPGMHETVLKQRNKQRKKQTMPVSLTKHPNA